MFTSCGSASKLSKADTPWTYEIESVGVGADGTYAIRVWSYYKNAKMPLEVAKRNAVHVCRQATEPRRSLRWSRGS